MRLFKRRSFLSGLFTICAGATVSAEPILKAPHKCAKCKDSGLEVWTLYDGGAIKAVPCPKCRTEEYIPAVKYLKETDENRFASTLDPKRHIPDFMKDDD